MPHLKVLGGAILSHAGEPVSGVSARRHPVAVLALLASAPSGTLSRGKLAGLLWPDVPERTARNRLNTYLHRLRAELGEDVLASVGDDLRLGAAVRSDVREFRDALADGDYERAVSLYGGSFLDGFRISGSPEFDQWADREAARLRQGYQEAVEALARNAEDRDRPEEAARWWQELLRDDPFDSRVVVRAMETLASAGNRPAALRISREHRARLEEELGAEPGEAVQAVTRRLAAAPEESTLSSRPQVGTPAKLAPRSVAVLPFEDLGGSDEAALFATGLHNDLLTRLSRVGALTVISRTSVLRYRDTELPIPRIARELGVGTVVEGSVQQAGNRVRLNVQLIDARSDIHRWAETYDRELTADNLFEIQGELAARIAESLHAALIPAERAAVEKPPTRDLDAYLLYAQGRTHLAQRTVTAIRRALRYFQRAIDRDPDYALAWAGLAEALMLVEYYLQHRPVTIEAQTFPDAAEAAGRAVQLDPILGEARTSLGILHSVRQNGPAAIRELKRAIELQPGYAEAHNWLGWTRMALGRPEEGLPSARRAAELDPLAPFVRAYLAEVYLANGKPDLALTEAQHAATLQPEYPAAHYFEGLSLYHLGRMAEAAFALEETRALTDSPTAAYHAEATAVLAATRVSSGDRNSARALLAGLRNGKDSFSVGVIHAALGERDQAFAAFQSVGRWGVTSTPMFRYMLPDVLGPLRRDPRYAEILRDVDRDWGLEGRPGGPG
jgi:TolB-like protein/Flp pilus assembly protein TadD